MDHEHGKRFSVEKAHRLDNPERLAQQPPPAVVDALELFPDTVVLDLGAGTGFFALPIAHRLAALDGHGRVLAADVEPRMNELLAQRASAEGLGARIELVLADEATGALPLGDGVADRALLASVWHELPDRAATLRELHRVLGPECMLLIIDWPLTEERVAGPPLDHRIPLESTLAELEAAGFREVESIELFELLYAVRAVRPL